MIQDSPRLRAFASMPDADVARWLQVNVEAYVEGEPNSKHFYPLDVFVRQIESVPAELATVFALLPAADRQGVRLAIAALAGKLDPRMWEQWLFVIELGWHMRATEIIPILEARCTEPFLDCLFGTEDADFARFIGLIRNLTVVKDGPSVRLLKRLVDYPAFDHSQARLTLLRLCELKPSHWTRHLATLRERLHRQMAGVRKLRGSEAMWQMQSDLATDLFSILGFDRISAGLPRLVLMKDAPGSAATDNWLYRGLTERTGILVITDRFEIASKENPSQPFPVPRSKLSTTSWSRDRISVEGENLPDMLNRLLGQNSLEHQTEWPVYELNGKSS